MPQFVRDAYTQGGTNLGPENPQDLASANPNFAWKLPIPATYVVGTDRFVAERFINANHTMRLEPADVLAAVRKATGG